MGSAILCCSFANRSFIVVTSGEKLQTYFHYRLPYCAVSVRKMPGHNSVILQIHFCTMGKSNKHHISMINWRRCQICWSVQEEPGTARVPWLYMFFLFLCPSFASSPTSSTQERLFLCVCCTCTVCSAAIPWVILLKSSLSTWPQCLGCFRTTNWKRFQVFLWSCCLPSFSSCSSSAKRRSSGL